MNIKEPDFINELNCVLKNSNLSSNIIYKCIIDKLNQEKRITNGIFINGIIKNNILDEYIVTNDNNYIKLIDFSGSYYKYLECPKNFEISHCKNLNKIEKKCIDCYKNYYLNDYKTQCLTCSQLNEGCSICNQTNGECIDCLDGFQKNESKCILQSNENKTSEPKCSEIDNNCETCSKSGYCKKCKEGYYLSGIDKKSKCIKCLSTCEECNSLNKCTKCKKDFILNKGSCVSCFSINEGCKECSQYNAKCTRCYNDNSFNYILNNNKCQKEKEENEEKEKNKINLKFERFDSYEKEDNIANFKLHFVLLNNFLYNAKLFIKAIIQKISGENRYRYLRLRGLSKMEDITCDQYGDALGNSNKGGYLANFKCSIDLDEDSELVSIEPKTMEIKDNENKTIESFQPEEKAFVVNELPSKSLDDEYEDINFYKITITNISDTKLKDEILYFNIMCNLDNSNITKDIEYEISLKDNNNNIINATCNLENINESNNLFIPCVSKIQENSVTLTPESGLYFSKNSDDIIIVSNDSSETSIKIPKKKGKNLGLIIGLTIAGVLILCIALFLIIKFIKNKKANNESNQPKDKHHLRNTDISKDLII